MAWKRYSGDLSMQEWSRKYDVLRANWARGKAQEALSGTAGAVYNTPYGRRVVDVNPATEIKLGDVSRTKFVRMQILKDVWLERNAPGYTPLWVFYGSASEPLLRHLETFGIPYVFR